MTYIGRAYLAAVLIGAVAPVVGVFLLQRRLALIGDGLGHLAFAGAALAAMAGMAALPWSLLIAAGGAMAIEVLQRRGRARADVALSVIFYLGIAAGVVMLSRAHRYDAAALSMLFGSLLTVSAPDIWVMAAVGAAVVTAVGVFYRSFFLLVLGEETAAAAGLRTGATGTLMSVLAAVVVVAGMRAVGVLLVAALMVVPAAAAERIANGFRATLLLSAVLGATCSLAGVWMAIRLNWPPGAAIVITSVGAFVLSLPAGAALRRRA